MNRLYILLIFAIVTSCASTNYPSNKHQFRAQAKRQSTYATFLKSKHLHSKHTEANRNIARKENYEWSYRREISGTNDIRNAYKASGGYGD